MTRDDKQLPDAVGLCPVHQDEFYFPLEVPLKSPFVRCPERGCKEFLRIYRRPGVVAGRSIR